MRHKKLFTAISLITLIFAKNSIAAKNYDDRWYVSPTASYLWLDDDRMTSRSGHGFSLGLGKAINKNINLEFKGIYNRYQHQGNDNSPNEYQWDTFGAAFEAQYYFSRGKIAPYLVASAGAMDSNISGQNAVGFIGDAGAGLAYKISNNLSIRSDVRYRYNDNFNKDITLGNRARYNDLSVNVGFVIPFGYNSSSKQKTIVKPTPQRRHQCNKYLKHKENLQAKAKKVELINQDLAGVNFAINSAKLRSKSRAILDKVAQNIKSHSSKGKIEVQGHTSSTGSAKTNLILSQKRAESVTNYLKSKKVENKMVAKGYGESQPIASNSTREGRLANRRVEILWK